MTGVAREWLARASEDLATVEKLFDDEELTNVAAFHAQQCIEKCFKAVIDAAGQPVPRIHDLVRLAALVSEITEMAMDETTLIELSTVYLDS
jgi:HEPN domain-containing protein